MSTQRRAIRWRMDGAGILHTIARNSHEEVNGKTAPPSKMAWLATKSLLLNLDVVLLMMLVFNKICNDAPPPLAGFRAFFGKPTNNKASLYIPIPPGSAILLPNLP